MLGVVGHACLNVDIEGVTLDGGGLAGVALSVLNGQYVNVGPANLIYGFTSIGGIADFKYTSCLRALLHCFPATLRSTLR